MPLRFGRRERLRRQIGPAVTPNPPPLFRALLNELRVELIAVGRWASSSGHRLVAFTCHTARRRCSSTFRTVKWPRELSVLAS